ncbi:MAG TPA: tetratricopeptide repeat protein [Polyangia bacterium]|nr:tetratricopeptide repeat protein [Polyangia bacterium]
MRHARTVIAAWLALAASPAVADEVDDLGKKVFEVESQARELNASFRPPKAAGPEVAERRLVDAQLLYQLKNYDEAAILLLDVVERFPTSPAFPEAQFLLADCLYQKHDFLSARRYFTQVVERGPGSPGGVQVQQRRYQEALNRLIELSLRTEDFGPVETYLAKLAELPPSSLLPSVPYVKGKYYYFRGRREEAQAAFETIPAGSPYSFQARYFLATLRVKAGDNAAAIPILENLLTMPAKTDEEKRVQELAHMALGRLHYDRSEFAQAIDEYQKVPRTSPLFSDMLYEVAWTFIKNAGQVAIQLKDDQGKAKTEQQKEFQKAFRALDLLMLANPDSPQAPEVRVLIGNLQVRLGQLGQALDIFEKTRDEFEPVKKQLEQVLAQHGDTQAYFNELIGKNLERFDIAVYLPQAAVKWVRAEPEVERVVQVVGDISDMRKAVKDSENLIGRLERAVNSPARVNIFPELAAARERSLTLSNVLLDARQRLAKKRRELAAPVLAPDEQRQLDQLGGERMGLEQKLAQLPTKAEGYRERAQKSRMYLEQLDQQGSELNVMIQSMNAELVAAEKYYKDTRASQRMPAAEFQKLVDENRASIETLHQMHDQLRNDIQAAKETTGIGDELVQEEEQAKKQLKDVLGRERALIDKAETRMSPDARTKVSQISSILEHAGQIDATLQAFDAKIDQLVEERLVDIKAAIADEKGHMGDYKTKVESYAGESADVGGGITYASFHNVAKRFYDIVVHADVGMIDVAWANKQAKTDSAARIKRQEAAELKLLDDEFKEVMQEEK